FLRRLGALLRTVDAGRGFSENQRTSLRHAQGSTLARPENYYLCQNTNRTNDLRRGGGSHGARAPLPARASLRRFELVQPIPRSADAMRTPLEDDQSAR